MPTLIIEENQSRYPIGGCCAIANIRGFAEDHQLGGRNKVKYLEKMKEEIEEGCEKARFAAKSLMCITLTTEQLVMIDLIESMGFKSQQEDFAYRDPARTSYKVGVKLFLKNLYNPDAE